MRRAAPLLALLVACGPKPLRLIEGDAGVDAPAQDAPPVDALTRAETAAEDVSHAGCDGGCARVRVDPSGPFCVGVVESPANAGWSASPPLCDLRLTPFEVDAREVTVGRFRAFYAQWRGGALPAAREVRFANGLSLRVPLPSPGVTTEWSPNVAGCTWSDAPDGARDAHPLNCVGWNLAMSFCASEGGHLLTSTQYEYLARWHLAQTAEGRAFPWGDDAPGCARAHYGPCPGDDGLETRRAGSLAAVAGVFDLAGNVAELVADDFASYRTLAASPCWTRTRVDPLCLPTVIGDHYARGSSHQNDSEALLRSVFRPSMSVGDASPSRGFRCAYPLGPAGPAQGG